MRAGLAGCCVADGNREDRAVVDCVNFEHVAAVQIDTCGSEVCRGKSGRCAVSVDTSRIGAFRCIVVKVEFNGNAVADPASAASVIRPITEAATGWAQSRLTGVLDHEYKAVSVGISELEGKVGDEALNVQGCRKKGATCFIAAAICQSKPGAIQLCRTIEVQAAPSEAIPVRDRSGATGARGDRISG